MGRLLEINPVVIEVGTTEVFSPVFYIDNIKEENVSSVGATVGISGADITSFRVQLKTNNSLDWGTWFSSNNDFLNPDPDGYIKSLEKDVAPGQLTSGDSVQFTMTGLELFSQLRFGLTSTGNGLTTIGVSVAALS